MFEEKRELKEDINNIPNNCFTSRRTSIEAMLSEMKKSWEPTHIHHSRRTSHLKDFELESMLIREIPREHLFHDQETISFFQGKCTQREEFGATGHHRIKSSTSIESRDFNGTRS